MRTNKKLTMIFSFIILLIFFIGLFSLNTINNFRKNSQVSGDMSELTKEAGYLIIKSFLLVETDTLEEYSQIKSEIEIRRTGFDLLHQKVDPILHKFQESNKFDDNVNEFTKLTNSLMRIQKGSLIEAEKFVEKTKLEKDLRYGIRNISSELGNAELRGDVWFMEYHGKEALYQYKDEEHLDEWFESIEQVRERIEKLDLPEEKKRVLLEDIYLYQSTAPVIGEIAINQTKIESEKIFKIQQLQKTIDKFEGIEGRISNGISSQNDLLVRNTFWIVLIIVIIGVILLIISQIYILRPISKTSKAKRTKFGRRRGKYANKK